MSRWTVFGLLVAGITLLGQQAKPPIPTDAWSATFGTSPSITSTGTLTVPSITITGSAFSSPPSSILIHSTPWTITFLPHPGPDGIRHYEGYTYCLTHRIEILSSPHYSASEQRHTVIHEILHAWTCTGNTVNNRYYNSGEIIHDGLDRIATTIGTVLEDNPDLARWLVPETGVKESASGKGTQ